MHPAFVMVRSILAAVNAVALTLAGAPPAQAQDDEGCGKFAWPLARERGWFAVSGNPPVADGATIAAMPAGAIVVRLDRGAQAKFVQPPERKPRSEDSFGGAVRLPAPASDGLFQITVSQDAWVDVTQDGQFLRSAGSTGRGDCPGVRKSIRLNLRAVPLILQFSAVAAETIQFAITPVEQRPASGRRPR
jgi:hypothetical protein